MDSNSPKFCVLPTMAGWVACPDHCIISEGLYMAFLACKLSASGVYERILPYNSCQSENELYLLQLPVIFIIINCNNQYMYVVSEFASDHY